MTTISSYGPSAAFRWIKQGWRLYTKQFVRMTLLFMCAFSAVMMLSYLPLIGLLCSLLGMPLIQMLLFNAAFGTRLRGYFKSDDLAQKLRGSRIWSRLILASLLLTLITFALLNLTLPSMPISMEAFMDLSSAQMQTMLEQTFTPSTMATSIVVMLVFYILTFWIYPLICWEDMGVVQAFMQSFKISMSNALPISLMVIFFGVIAVLGVLITSMLSWIMPYLVLVVLLFGINILMVAFYMSLFCSYMEILYGENQSV